MRPGSHSNFLSFSCLFEGGPLLGNAYLIILCLRASAYCNWALNRGEALNRGIKILPPHARETIRHVSCFDYFLFSVLFFRMISNVFCYGPSNTY